jgi:N-acetylglutamate synthase-like GNAT family acetyltransferase
MTRDGTEADIPAIVDMAREFWKHTMYDEEFDAEHVAGMTHYALSQGLLAVLEVDGVVAGFTAGICGPILGNSKVLQGTEIAWWINPDARKGRQSVELLHHIEAQAKAIGVKYWNMISMESSAPHVAERIYLRHGYTHSETSYTRIL